MAKFFTHDGVVCLRKTAAEEAKHPIPVDATEVLVFDEESNAALIADFDAGCNPYTISGGQLRKNGVAVSFAADGNNKQARDGLRTQATQAVADNATYLAIGSPTNAQNLAQIRSLTQQNNRIIRRLVLLVNELGKE